MEGRGLTLVQLGEIPKIAANLPFMQHAYTLVMYRSST